MIDPGDVRTDMYSGSAPEAFDERLVLSGWTYYVRATKNPSGLVRDKDWGSGLDIGAGAADDFGGFLVFLALLAALPAGVMGVRAVRRPREDKRSWTVAVVRMGYVGSWNDLRPEVVHREEVSREDSPEPRIAALVADVRAGKFHPAA